MAKLETRAPATEQEWQRYHDLRWRILRAPWEPDSSPRAEDDDDSSMHRMLCTDAGEVLAVARLHEVDARTAQVRFMAVEQGHERKGYGSRLLRALEQLALAHDYANVMLQARENAVPFYRHHGYRVVEKTFLLFGEIQHYRMIKRLEEQNG